MSDEFVVAIVAIVSVSLVSLAIVVIASGALPRFKANAREVEFKAKKR